MLPKLNFPEYSFRIKKNKGDLFIFDPVRKKFVKLTPEEWVRQHVLCYLIEEKNFPTSLLVVEKELSVFNRTLRPDVIAYNNDKKPVFLVECKAPDVEINAKTWDQALIYNLKLGIKVVFLTNGFQHLCVVSEDEKEPSFIKDIPMYPDLLEIAL